MVAHNQSFLSCFAICCSFHTCSAMSRTCLQLMTPSVISSVKSVFTLASSTASGLVCHTSRARVRGQDSNSWIESTGWTRLTSWLNSSATLSVSYKLSSSLGSGFELVDQVYRLNSTHKSWTRESNSVWLTSSDPGLKLGSWTCESSRTRELTQFICHTSYGKRKYRDESLVGKWRKRLQDPEIIRCFQELNEAWDKGQSE